MKRFLVVERRKQEGSGGKRRRVGKERRVEGRGNRKRMAASSFSTFISLHPPTTHTRTYTHTFTHAHSHISAVNMVEAEATLGGPEKLSKKVCECMHVCVRVCAHLCMNV